MANCEFTNTPRFMLWARAIDYAYGTNPERLMEELSKAFSNPEKALNFLGKGTEAGNTEGESNKAPLVVTSTPKPVKNNPIDNYSIPIGNVDDTSSFFKGGIGQAQMEIEFRRKILEASLLTIGEDGAVQYIEREGGVDGLNIDKVQYNLINFKNTLLTTMARADGIEYTPDYIRGNDSDEAYTDKVRNAIAAFEKLIATNPSRKLQESEPYKAYVMLKSFDQLLRKVANYIDIDSSYEGRSESIVKYSFKPTVKHRQNFAKTDQSDASKQVGNLAEAILRVIPDVDEVGKALSSNVGVGGFNATMQMLKKVALYTNMLEVKEGAAEGFRNAVLSGAGALLDRSNPYNLSNMIDAFITSQKANKDGSYNKYRQAFLGNKLRGIQRALFNEKTPVDIQNMFCQMFSKYEATEYRVYGFDNDAGEFKSMSLGAKMYSPQVYAFKSILNGGFKMLSSDSGILATKLDNKYKFTLKGNALIITDDKGRSMTLEGSKIDEVHFTDDVNDELLSDFMLDAFSYLIPESYADCITDPTGKYVWEDDFAAAVMAAAKMTCDKRGRLLNVPGISMNQGNAKLDPINSVINRVGERLGTIYGDSIKSTIKSLGGNSLPVNGLTSLEYNFRSCIDDVRKQMEKLDEVTEGRGFNECENYHNLLYKDADMVMAPFIRGECSINGVTKDPNAMNVNELNRIAIVNDFFENLGNVNDKNAGIYLQNATFSDKGRQFVLGFKSNYIIKDGRINARFKSLLKGKDVTLNNIISYSLKHGFDAFSDAIRDIRRDKYQAAVTSVLKAYNAVFGDQVTVPKPRVNEEGAKAVYEAFNDLDTKLEKGLLVYDGKSIKSLGDLRDAFAAAGVDFKEEDYAYAPKADGLGKIRVNETMKEYLRMTLSKANWDAKMAFYQGKYADDLAPMIMNGTDEGTGFQVANIIGSKLFTENAHKGFYNPKTQELVLAKDGQLHDLAKAYFWTDTLLSQEFNTMTGGEIWSHPNKVKSYDPNTYLEEAEANRLVNQIKRSVIYGSTIHSFGQGLKNSAGKEIGVTSKLRVAILGDVSADVQTINGVNDTCDSQDGSGRCTALQAILENNSLADAAVGDNKKTILHSIDHTTGQPVLFKWAVYAYTNRVRREGAASTDDVENIVEKMYSVYFTDPGIDMNAVYRDYSKKNGTIWIKDQNSLEMKELLGFRRNTDGTWTQLLRGEDQVTSEGLTTGISRLYDIDQLYGGAWTYHKENGKWIGDETSTHALAATAIEYDLRDKQIAYAVNASACKVGATNVNGADAWHSRHDPKNPLRTFEVSSKYAGVMMNADHELDEAEVTEMSQMISALIEDGHYTELVDRIYSEIGDIAYNNAKIQRWVKTANSGDIAAIKSLIGESLIKAFSTGSKDTIGLAQAFMRKASAEARARGINTYDIPLNDTTIWKAAVSNVASTITKQGIKRKYEGFAGVLNPSFNQAMYFGSGMMFDQFNNECKQRFAEIGITNLGGVRNWVKLAQKPFFYVGDQKVYSPFMEKVDTWDIDFEDTVFIQDAEGNFVADKNGKPIEIRVKDFETYDELRNFGTYNGIPLNTKDNIRPASGTYTLWRNNACPRNLRGCDTTFEVVDDNGENYRSYSLYETDVVRAHTYFNQINKAAKKGKTPANYDAKKAFLDAYLAKKGITKPTEQFFTNETAKLLKILDDSSAFYQAKLKGESVPETDYTSIEANSCFKNVLPGTVLRVKSYVTRPAEIIAGRYQMSKLGIDSSDFLSDIKGPEFFEQKLRDQYKSLSDDAIEFGKKGNKAIKRTLYHNGVAFTVAVGEVDSDFVEKNFEPAAEVNVVNDDLRFGKDVILSGENLDRFNFKIHHGKTGDSYMIIVNNEDDLEELTNSSFFDDFYVDGDDDYKSIKAKIAKIARNRYAAFQKGISFVGARIPTQAMQSFMPFKVVAFADCETNVVYVPAHNTFIEGSDYDIDKIYLLTSTIGENGTLESGSNLQSRIGYDNAIKLVRPSGREVVEDLTGVGLPGVAVDFAMKALDDHNGSAFVTLANRVLKQQSDVIKVNIQGGNAESNAKFLDLLKRHEATKSYKKDSAEALKNRVFDGIYQVTRASQNQIKAQITVDTCTGEMKDTASKTTGGNAEKKITPYTPSSKYVMQVQNQLGKAVVGIGAVSLKTYFILNTHSNKVLNKIAEAVQRPLTNEEIEGLRMELVKISFINPITKQWGVLNGTNISDTKRAVEAAALTDPRLNVLLYSPTGLINLETNACPEYAAENLSGIVSLAADNAKDLALPKLNATADLVDIYTTAFMLGVPFKKISDIMTGKVFNWMIKAGAQNIFDASSLKNKVKDMVKFYLEEDPDNRLTKRIMSTLTINKGDDEKLPSFYSIIHSDELLDKYIARYEDIIASTENLEDAQEIVEGQDRPGIVYGKRSRLEELNLLRKYKEMMQFRTPEFKEQVALLSKILIAVEEMSTLGQQGSINQGLKTDPYYFKASIEKIQDLVNTRIAALPEDLRVGLSPFNFMEYLSDEEYRDSWDGFIEQTNIFKYFNILNALKNSPNFFAMSRLMPVTEKCLKTIDMYAITFKIANGIRASVNHHYVTDREFNAIADYLTDKSIFNYFKNSGQTLDLKAIEAEVGKRPVLYHYDEGAAMIADELLLDNLDAIATFKHAVEDVIVPYLKEKYPTNSFIAALTPRENRKTQTNVMCLPIAMMSVESDEASMEKYTNYLNDFDQISRATVGGKTVGDWFFLYNLVANKNGYGDNALTKIFENLINSERLPESIAGYYQSISSIAYEDTDVKNAIAYIVDHVKETTLTTNRTFNRPNENYTLSLFSEVDQTIGSKINASQVVYMLADRIRELGGNIYIHKKEEGKDDPFKGVKGYVKDGKIMINLQALKNTASAIGVTFHELSHVMLAAMKVGDTSKYFELLDKVRELPNYKELAQGFGDKLTGYDISEEVLCKYLEDMINGKVNTHTQFYVNSKGLMLDKLRWIFDSDKNDPVRILGDYIISQLDSDAFDTQYVEINSKIAGYKNILLNSQYKQNKLEQECN